jgi:hypothetical protein
LSDPDDATAINPLSLNSRSNAQVVRPSRMIVEPPDG